MNLIPFFISTTLTLLVAPLASAAGTGHGAHVHGQVQAQVVVDGSTLRVELAIPLDSLLGFEHRPRTAAQRQAAQAALASLKQAGAWLKPDPAALCNLRSTEINDQALQPAVAGTAEAGHADVEASYDFSCAVPARLVGLELQLASVFKRIRRIDVQVAGARGQGRQTLVAPQTRITLAP